MAAMVHHINQTQQKHVVTIENPIEFLHRDLNCSITQREVGVDTATYASGLRAALRQDPDVVVIGELADAETVDTAIKAAETGLLVIASMPTPDVATTVERVVSMLPKDEREIGRMRFAEALRAIVSQQLLPRQDENGRVVACEILLGTPEVRAALRDTARIGDLKGLMADGGSAGHADLRAGAGGAGVGRQDHRRGGAGRHAAERHAAARRRAGAPEAVQGLAPCRRAARGAGPDLVGASGGGNTGRRRRPAQPSSQLPRRARLQRPEQPFRFNAGIYRALPAGGALLSCSALLEHSAAPAAGCRAGARSRSCWCHCGSGVDRRGRVLLRRRDARTRRDGRQPHRACGGERGRAPLAGGAPRYQGAGAVHGRPAGGGLGRR